MDSICPFFNGREQEKEARKDQRKCDSEGLSFMLWIKKLWWGNPSAWAG
jgi:hypothetical protein